MKDGYIGNRLSVDGVCALGGSDLKCAILNSSPKPPLESTQSHKGEPAP